MEWVSHRGCHGVALCCGEPTSPLPNVVLSWQEAPSSLSPHAYSIPLQQSMG